LERGPARRTTLLPVIVSTPVEKSPNRRVKIPHPWMSGG